MPSKIAEYNATIEALMGRLDNVIYLAGAEPYRITKIEFVPLKMNEVGDMLTNMLLKVTEVAERTDQAFIPVDYSPKIEDGFAMLDAELTRINHWFTV